MEDLNDSDKFSKQPNKRINKQKSILHVISSMNFLLKVKINQQNTCTPQLV
jgi:hypothetical protein